MTKTVASNELSETQLDSISGGCHRRCYEEESCHEKKNYCEDYNDEYECRPKYDSCSDDYDYERCHRPRRCHRSWE